MRTHQPLSEYAPAKPPLPSSDPEPASLPASSVVGAAELIAAGFEPLELLTGSDWIAVDWPNQRKRALPESRPDRLPDGADEQVWFVKSPWPSLAPFDALGVIWANLPRDDDVSRAEAAREILRWSDERAVAAFVALDLQD